MLANLANRAVDSPRSVWTFSEMCSCKFRNFVPYHRISLLQQEAVLPPVGTYLTKLHRVLSGTSDRLGSAIFAQQRPLRLHCAKGASGTHSAPVRPVHE